ncbi:MAG: hypothetical protein O3A84_16775, partial [Proteobacteria bacterium]|nr:hypothetical protein [Pseudomonadota bacterium]
ATSSSPGYAALLLPHHQHSAISPVSQITDSKGFRADYGKMPFLGAFINPAVLYVSTDKIKNRDAILTGKPATYGGQRPHLRFDLMGRMTLDLMGADYRYITGYGGGAKVLQAMRRQEVDLQTVGLNLYRLSAETALVKTGKATPLWYYDYPGWEQSAAKIMPDFPSFEDHYKKIKGKAPSGEKYEVYKWLTKTVNGMSYSAFVPPNTSDATVATLRKAFDDAAKDPAYLAEQRKLFGFNLPYIDVPKGQAVINTLLNAPPKYIAYFNHSASRRAWHHQSKAEYGCGDCR